ncbi:phosphopantetheine-binding protein [Streptomyces sp. NPDC089919]|uniref:phosphopantetheine-binding protein n=1 Tax=Streptomyces sp. NPDC089919 TaxID=3155188 RepID=UPI00342245A7
MTTVSAQESVFAALRDLLVDKFDVPAADARPDAAMRDLLVDSLMVVEMAIAVHETLGVKVEEEELREATLADLAAAVHRRHAAS